MALPPAHPPFVDSVRRRGLNVSDVGCGVISRGWFGAAQPAYGGGRVAMAKMQCFVTAGSTNFYARPLEGVTLVVDAWPSSGTGQGGGAGAQGRGHGLPGGEARPALHRAGHGARRGRAAGGQRIPH
ncbi:unnamed protein product [Miscanthus lutarioriparius]|uniref:Copper amine oxidase N3-terminal domain-containing protein n=1 Tax=Miscanthus lutarioriparius TaxID=422564 RepID=A0A811PCY5_9POAL|nr:unnamed protein product [Miscanthus lutarioriparius]